MIMATETSSDPATPKHTKSISSIALVPNSGESSPTSVLVDVTAENTVGISELKLIQGYSNQLLMPEAIIYGNDIIKVWNIDDERMIGEGSESTMIQYQEDSPYKKTTIHPIRPKSMKETTKAAMSTNTKPISSMEEHMDKSHSMDIDDLFLALPTTTDSLSPRFSPRPISPPTTVSLPQIFLPLSPLATSGCTSRNSGNKNTIVLENLSVDEESVVPSLSTTKASRGHRRGHRRNRSHFDFKFK